MTERDLISLIVQAARMYHEQGMTQPEIAEALSVSQSRVSRWLAEAQRLDIVRTVVIPPEGMHTDLEESIGDRYGLRQVIVVYVSGDERSILSGLGSSAARYLEATLATSAHVGVSSYSSALMSTVESMVPLRKRRLASIVQIMGGIGRPDVQVLATSMADRFARITGAQAVFLPTPGLVASSETRDALYRDPIVATAAAEWPKLTDVIVGVGSLEPSELLRSSGNSVSQDEMEMLRGAGAVGDVAMRFFDAEGRPIVTELDNRIIGISAEELLRIPRRIGIAGGERKYSAIRAAVRGKWIDVLITDIETARRLADDPD